MIINQCIFPFSGDWLLKFLYRSASVQFTIAGLGPIDWMDRRMHNMDLSEIVSTHLSLSLLCMNRIIHHLCVYVIQDLLVDILLSYF